MNKKFLIVFLLLIYFLTFFVRNYTWNHGRADVDLWGSDYMVIAQELLQESDASEGDHWRAGLQFIYPLYLTPIYIFNLEVEDYLYYMHMIFSLATATFMILSGWLLRNLLAGLIAALAFSVHLQIAWHFNFIEAAVTTQFHAALFVLANLWFLQKCSPLRYLAVLISGFLLGFTRPEGLAVFGLVHLYYVYLYLRAKINLKIAIVSTLAIPVLSATFGLLYLSHNDSTREKVLSHLFVGHGLDLGSQWTKTTVEEVNAQRFDMFSYGSRMSEADPYKRGPWYWNSLRGIERIKSDPFNYVLVVADRYLSCFMPTLYRSGVSWKYMLFDICINIFVVLGTILAYLKSSKHLYPMYTSMIIVAFAIYTVVAFYQNEWDVRVPLTAHIPLFIIGSCGWSLLLGRLLARMRLLDDSSNVKA